jgi:DNA repair protein RecO (recombination protein O)
VLYEGKGELHTVTQAETIQSYPRLREHGASLSAAGVASESVLRLFGEGEVNDAAYNLLCRELQLLDVEPRIAGPANLLAFRLKLLLAAGFLPELVACARCGSGASAESSGGLPRDGFKFFSAAAGGVVCRDCVGGDAFGLDRSARSFMLSALAGPLQDVPPLSAAAVSQVDRVVSGTLEYHAHVRLRSVA